MDGMTDRRMEVFTISTLIKCGDKYLGIIKSPP